MMGTKVRDTRTGRYLRKRTEKRRPSTTVVERDNPRRPKR
jgi:hypothetical protein